VDADFNLLSRMLKHSPLTSLHLSNGALESIRGNSAMIGWALRGNQNLTHLNLSHNRLLASGAGHVLEALLLNCTLRWLEIAGNDMGYMGAKAVGELLTHSDTLTALDISDNDLNSAVIMDSFTQVQCTTSIHRTPCTI
jgi:hypothetical protein